MILIFSIRIRMINGNRMIELELKGSSGNLIARIVECYKINIGKRLNWLHHFAMSDQQAKYELHICIDIILFIYNFFVKKKPAIQSHKPRLQAKF